MPQKRPEGTPEEEIEAFARRMIHEIEELDYAANRRDWLNFVSDKIWRDRGVTLSDAALDALDRGRFSVVGMWGDVGIRAETPFVTRPTQVRYRDVTTGRWASKATVNVALQGRIPRGGRR